MKLISSSFFTLFLLGLLNSWSVSGQILIHSHNDYDRVRPFWEAYSQRADFIEADVYPVNGQLLVAHDKTDINPYRTLRSEYILPIVTLFRDQENNSVSPDSSYTFYLMIDIKEKWEEVLPLLEKITQKYPLYFDRKKNPKAIQIFVSGERPPINTFHEYPGTIEFDGLPGTKYAPEDLNKITMISTNFRDYSLWDGKGKIPEEDAEKLRTIIKEAHAIGKPMRFWGAPDTRSCWQALIDLGADVINTDHLKETKEVIQEKEDNGR